MAAGACHDTVTMLPLTDAVKFVGAPGGGLMALFLTTRFTLAMVGGLGLKTLARTIHPYPTQAEVNKKVVNLWRKAHFTQRTRNILSKWFSWTR